MTISTRSVFLATLMMLAIHLLGIGAHHLGHFLNSPDQFWPYKIFLWGTSMPALFGFIWTGVQAYKRLK